jgi:hypothetical protein
MPRSRLVPSWAGPIDTRLAGWCPAGPARCDSDFSDRGTGGLWIAGSIWPVLTGGWLGRNFGIWGPISRVLGLVMWPSFQQQVRPALPESLHKWYFAAATVHALLGGTAELLGLYIVIVAGTRVLPESLRFKNWKRWMRAELMLRSIVVLTGVGTYYAWYIAPFR